MVFVRSRATVVGAVRATKDTITVGLRFYRSGLIKNTIQEIEFATLQFPFADRETKHLLTDSTIVQARARAARPKKNTAHKV